MIVVIDRSFIRLNHAENQATVDLDGRFLIGLQ